MLYPKKALIDQDDICIYVLLVSINSRSMAVIFNLVFSAVFDKSLSGQDDMGSYSFES